ncbi:MAG: hypothetical protein AAF533_05305 [Acidobacteriota bacterium]
MSTFAIRTRHPLTLTACLLATLLFTTSASAQVLYHDTFDDDDPATNTGGIGSGWDLPFNEPGASLSESGGEMTVNSPPSQNSLAAYRTIGTFDHEMQPYEVQWVLTFDELEDANTHSFAVTDVGPFNGRAISLVLQRDGFARTELRLFNGPVRTNFDSSHTPANRVDGYTVTLTVDMNGVTWSSPEIDLEIVAPWADAHPDIDFASMHSGPFHVSGMVHRAHISQNPFADQHTIRLDEVIVNRLEVTDCCPDDPDKLEPGLCGCGVPDDDSDGDTVPDCLDCCPDDPFKTEAGACGCGFTDDDSDADGVVDCFDCCPDDPGKTDAGTCGCGIADVDSDGDGVLDCNDECPDDPDKTDAGTCGCGVSDVDSDADGLPDCLDTLVCDDCEMRLLLEAALPGLSSDPACGVDLPLDPAPCCPLVVAAVDALTGDVLPSTHPCAAPCAGPCQSHDFDGLTAGTVVTTEFSGLTISGTSPVMIFDTSDPTCGDDDLLTPGTGPGNVSDLGGVLILSEPGSSCSPDDARDGGVMTIEADEPIELHSIGLLDVDDDEVIVRTWDDTGSLIREVVVPPQGVDNGWQSVLIERCGVKTIEIETTGSMAVTDLTCARDVVRSRLTGRRDDADPRSRSGRLDLIERRGGRR